MATVAKYATKTAKAKAKKEAVEAAAKKADAPPPSKPPKKDKDSEEPKEGDGKDGGYVEGGGKAKKSESSYPNAKEVELDNKGRFRDKNGNLRDNAGPNAPKFDKWKEKGGTVKYDEATDTIIYGKPNMETSTMGKLDVDVPYKPGPPDGQRYPDFSSYSKENVSINNMRGVPETKIKAPEGGDFSKAWEELSRKNGDEYVKNTYGVTRRGSGSRAGSWPDKSPRGNTWHHNGNSSSMELIDHEIHRTFTHAGGASAVR